MTVRANEESFRKAVMVTGGAAFLGSHLCDRLIRQGYEVLCVDNFYTGSRRILVQLLDNPHFEVLRHDVTMSRCTMPLYVEVDDIFNLACP
jgi:UDP-glucuronate decarboxylase